MIIRRLPILLLCLVKVHGASESFPNGLGALADTALPEVTAPSIPQLDNQLSQMTLGGNIPEEQTDNTSNTKSLLSPFEISDKINELIGTVSTLDIKAAVEVIDKGLDQILASGVCLNDIAPTIGSLPFEAKELVLAAIEKEAHTLLNLLQMVYIWHDDHEYHWFMALIGNEPWRIKNLRNDPVLFPLDWRNNLRAICEADNVDLAVIIRKNVPHGDALKSFDGELLSLCIEYDAIRVFESLKLNPDQLGDHLESLAKSSAVKLLALYKDHTESPNLHLERFPFPEKLPTNIRGLIFLMNNGCNFFPISNFIEGFCKEGRLDLLKYIHSKGSNLVPCESELIYAAKNNFKDILDWGRQVDSLRKSWIYQFGPRYSFTYHSICNKLLAHGHFDTLCWWIDVNGITIDKQAITMIIRFGALKVFQWIDNLQLAKYSIQEVADSAAENQHLHILEWLYEKYGILPDAMYLRNANIAILDWVKSKSCALEDPLLAMRLNGIDVKYEDLIEEGAWNFELLQWVFKNAPLSVFDNKEEILSKSIRGNEMMLWLHKELKICPSEMNGAYYMGDLKAIKWAAKNCDVYPTAKNAETAAKRGHFHIITWIHENAYPKNPSCLNIYTLSAAVLSGNLEIAEYLMCHILPEAKITVSIDDDISTDKCLVMLEWARRHGFDFAGSSDSYLSVAFGHKDTQVLEWLSANPTILTIDARNLSQWWYTLIRGNLHKHYRWLLETYPKVRSSEELKVDALNAYTGGSLGILKVLYEKDPCLLQRVPNEIALKHNLHICQWLTAINYHSVGQGSWSRCA